MSDAAIAEVLTRMRALAREIEAPASTPAPAGTESFSAVLARAVDGVAGAQARAGELARAYETGAADVELAEVMVSMQQASVGFTAVTQVRNKLLAAYQDIMNMPL